MVQNQKNYKFIDWTVSLCPKCSKRVDAKIILRNNSVFLLKNCSEHGEQINILEEDSDYYLRREDYDKPGTICKTQTKIKNGCPFDCGLCSDHEQHTCIWLIKIGRAHV